MVGGGSSMGTPALSGASMSSKWMIPPTAGAPRVLLPPPRPPIGPLPAPWRGAEVPGRYVNPARSAVTVAAGAALSPPSASPSGPGPGPLGPGPFAPASPPSLVRPQLGAGANSWIRTVDRSALASSSTHASSSSIGCGPMTPRQLAKCSGALHGEREIRNLGTARVALIRAAALLTQGKVSTWVLRG